MTAVSKKQLRVYLAELAIIVFGILIAFQVEEWRDERRNEQDMQASLQRLAEEIKQNLAICEARLPVHRRVTRGVEQAFVSLRSGELRDQDLQAFEAGLRFAAALPNFTVLTSVADEMISTGMLREIDDHELRQAIPKIQAWQNISNLAYANRRTSVRDLTAVLYDYVEIEFDDLTPEIEQRGEPGASLEVETRVFYDFDEMATDKRLINLYFEALDSHVDLLRDVERLCGFAADIDDRLKLIISE